MYINIYKISCIIGLRLQSNQSYTPAHIFQTNFIFKAVYNTHILCILCGFSFLFSFLAVSWINLLFSSFLFIYKIEKTKLFSVSKADCGDNANNFIHVFAIWKIVCKYNIIVIFNLLLSISDSNNLILKVYSSAFGLNLWFAVIYFFIEKIRIEFDNKKKERKRKRNSQSAKNDYWMIK